ncbi:MAG: hypothetical protein M3077_07180 [Candidatus Dormibacteraeota bacterium]|nr:hypothetical protein [Candidatus Dormibacteraeota bacterium]
MAEATVPVWVALAGPGVLAAGYLIKVADDYFREGRTTKREQDAHTAERERIRRDRRDEFERDTLLKLQEALVELNRETVLVDGTLDSRDRWIAARGNVTTLRVRVLDDKLRQFVNKFEGVTQEMIEAPPLADDESKKRSDDLHEKRLDGFANVNERLGELLRALYYVSEPTQSKSVIR